MSDEVVSGLPVSGGGGITNKLAAFDFKLKLLFGSRNIVGCGHKKYGGRCSEQNAIACFVIMLVIAVFEQIIWPG